MKVDDLVERIRAGGAGSVRVIVPIPVRSGVEHSNDSQDRQKYIDVGSEESGLDTVLEDAAPRQVGFLLCFDDVCEFLFLTEQPALVGQDGVDLLVAGDLSDLAVSGCAGEAGRYAGRLRLRNTQAHSRKQRRRTVQPVVLAAGAFTRDLSPARGPQPRSCGRRRRSWFAS
jgi:hypothetical protein